MTEAYPARLLGESASYISLMEACLSKVVTHRYRFVDAGWLEKNAASLGTPSLNALMANEILQKSHLAASTSLLRSSELLRGFLLAVEHDNVLMWAHSARALLESAGDTVHSLKNMPVYLAPKRRAVEAVLGRVLFRGALRV